MKSRGFIESCHLGRSMGGGEEDYLDDEGGCDCIPPHEFLAGTRMGCSFSVHKGVGRTINGRDLSRVRNAIWAKTGFQD
ncbi:hypothetical protein MLD38_006684 [Melastoma candidum]|uniref:Uncharacterized protein n=1 Tax=Melastoma candidum TaxID=119954 RepID=A0ACB9RQJ3_9MYRT|nr:hypothetical protein MLD38_006684 [Melastoma candidum]